MKLIKTKSFELAVYAKGDPNATKLAIITPGRLDSKDYAHNTALVDYLAEHGYYAVAFDPPGTWESPGGIDLYSTTNCVKAINELIEHFGNKPTLLAGHSRGGSTTLVAAPRNIYVTHLVAIMSHYTMPGAPTEDELTNGVLVELRDLPPGTSRTEEKKRYELPLSYFEDGKELFDPAVLRDCHKPKLFFYGKRDTINNPENVKKAFALAGEPKMIYGVESEHDYRLHPEIITEVNETIGTFLQRYP